MGRSISTLMVEHAFNIEYAQEIDHYQIVDDQIDKLLDRVGELNFIEKNSIQNRGNDKAYKEASEQIRTFLKTLKINGFSKSVPPALR